MKFKDTIRAKTKRTSGHSLPTIITDINRTLRGWFEYFKHAHVDTFRPLDAFIRRRLRTLLRKQLRKRSGTGRTLADHKLWTNDFFAQAGLLALCGAWTEARHSRRG